MRFASLILIAAGAAGCGGAAGPELAQVNVPFSLSVGERAMVGGIAIRFAGVPQDSRCPSSVVCIWEGDAAVALDIEPYAGGADTLHTRLDPRTLVLDAGTLELVRLDPYPGSPGPIPQSDYVATFVAR